MTDRTGVDLVVPDTFEAYIRIHHRIQTGETWREFAPEFLVRGVEPYDYHGSKLSSIETEGDLDPDVADALVALLVAETSTPDRCHYALWGGWGWEHPSAMYVWTSDRDAARAHEAARHAAMAPVWEFTTACAVQPWWGGRDMLLFDGPIDAVSRIGYPDPFEQRLLRQSPQWWWPEDRAWFVGTEIDFAWTYVGGARSLIDRIMSTPDWETVEIHSNDLW